jgi:DNA-binding transcriptional regulator YiaG
MNERSNHARIDVKELRIALDMTQTQFAEEVGVSQGRVSQWEAGRGRPKGSALKILFRLQATTLQKEAAE